MQLYSCRLQKYVLTSSKGLVEFMLWCQDMSLEPLLVVWSGLPFGGGAAVTGTDLEPYIEEAVAALDVSTDLSTSRVLIC